MAFLCALPGRNFQGRKDDRTQLLTYDFKTGQNRRISDPPKTRLQPTFVALGPLGDTAQGVETKLGPNWSRKGDFPLSARYLIEDLGPGSPPVLGKIFLDSSPLSSHLNHHPRGSIEPGLAKFGQIFV